MAISPSGRGVVKPCRGLPYGTVQPTSGPVRVRATLEARTSREVATVLLQRVFKVALSPELLLMVSKVYIPVLFPTTFVIAWLSLRLDAALGVSSFLPSPLNYGVALLFMAVGGGIWIISYTHLISWGDGSPSPTAGRTRKLVVRGVYAHCRNPSVWGKLLGVLSVGLALNSASFCFLLIPAILAVSLVEKVVRQEPQLVDVFGDEYEEYRKHVPLFLPRITPWRPDAQESPP